MKTFKSGPQGAVLGAFLAFLLVGTGLAISQGQTVLGELKRLTRIWDGTDVALVSAGGALLVDGSATTQPVSGTFWQATQPVSGTFWQATQPVSGTVTVTDGAGALNVIVDSGTITANPSEPTASGTLSDDCANPCVTSAEVANSVVKVALNNAGAAQLIFLTSNLVGTLEFADSPDGENWVANNYVRLFDGQRLAVGVSTFSNPTALHTYAPNVTPGAKWVRIRVVTYTSGSATVTWNASSTDNYNVMLPVSGWPTLQVPQRAVMMAGHDGSTSCNGTACLVPLLNAAAPALDVAGVVTRNVEPTYGTGSGATGGLPVPVIACDSWAPVDIVTATTTLIITGVAGRHVYICSISLIAGGADNVAIVSGTDATCATSTAGMNGGVTAAEGYVLAANGGIAQGNGLGAIMRTETAQDSVCIITSAAVQLSGTISYAIF